MIPVAQEDSHALPNESGMYSLILKLAEGFKGPLSFSVFMAMLVTMGWLSYDHVSKTDLHGLEGQLQELRTQIKSLQYTFDHNHLDSRLNTVKDKLFEVKQRMAAEKDKDSVVESLYNEQQK